MATRRPVLPPRGCCRTPLGDPHAPGCHAPETALLARARMEASFTGLLRQQEAAPLYRRAPSVARLDATALQLCRLLDGAALRLHAAASAGVWLESWLLARREAVSLAAEMMFVPEVMA